MKTLMLVLSLILVFPALADVEKGEVTLPIDKYTEMKDRTEAPQLTVIEDIQIRGEFGKTLTLSVSGASSGKPALAEFMEIEKGSLHNCKGSAVLQRSNHSLSLLPQSSRFSLTCSLTMANWNDVNLIFFNALYIDAKVSGGETIITGEPSRQSVVLTRTSTAVDNERAEVTSVSRYRITVLPEESRFQYNFELSNPGRSIRTFILPLVNQEIVQGVSSESDYKDTTTQISFSLLPGNNSISVSGRFQAKNFKSPIANSQSFLLVENSPMIQLTIATKARRISASDAGIGTQYSTSRAYLLNAADEISWVPKKLEVFASTGYAINSADYLVYIPRNGKGIVEAAFEINNQGTPEIPLKVPGRITYVEVAGIPQVLLKDSTNALLLQVPTGVHRVLVQYEGEKAIGQVGQIIGAELVKPDAVMSDVSINMRLAPKWDLLAGKALYDTKSDLHFYKILFALILGFFTFYLMQRFAFRKRESVLGGIVICLITASIDSAGTLYLFLLAVIAIIRYRVYLKEKWPKKSWVQVGLIVVGLFIFVVISKSLDNFRESFSSAKMSSGSAMLNESYDAESFGGGAPAAAPKMDMAKGKSDGSYDEASSGPVGTSAEIKEPDYQGVPARVKIPSEGRDLYYKQGMLDKASAVEYQLFLISDAILGFIVGLCMLWILWLIYREQQKFKSIVMNN